MREVVVLIGSKNVEVLIVKFLNLTNFSKKRIHFPLINCLLSLGLFNVYEQ